MGGVFISKKNTGIFTNPPNDHSIRHSGCACACSEGPQKLPCRLWEKGVPYSMWEHCTTAKRPPGGPRLARGQRVVVCAHARRNLSGPKKDGGRFLTGSRERACGHDDQTCREIKKGPTCQLPARPIKTGTSPPSPQDWEGEGGGT